MRTWNGAVDWLRPARHLRVRSSSRVEHKPSYNSAENLDQDLQYNDVIEALPTRTLLPM